ncbi:MAG: thioredoxin domain-containing protein [Candidatus Roizmanbacteria bacterium]|nr:thioredoxin domain-containing protein [Candidatus Roizmanbacteria bacterium]
MPPKKTKKVATSTNPKKETAKVQVPKMQMEEPKTSPESSIINRLSQQFNLLAILIVALFLFQGYTFYQVKIIEKKGIVGAAGQAQESPLSQESLISYAKDLKLKEKDFKSCLESGDKASIVSAEAAEGAKLGVQGTPGFFINGRFLGGAFPFETFKEIIDKEIAGTGSDNCTDYSEDLQQYCSNPDPQQQPFKPAKVEVAIGDSPSIGSKDAKVTIVEFSDFECPYCARAFATVKQIKDAYPKDVKIVYKQLPLTNIHPNAQKAAEASICAKDQGKFWEMHDKIFESQGA